MLARVSCKCRGIARSSTDIGHLVRRHRAAYAGTVDYDANIGLIITNRPRHSVSKVGIVDRVRRICAKILDRKAQPRKISLQLFLYWKAAVVGTDGDRPCVDLIVTRRFSNKLDSLFAAKIVSQWRQASVLSDPDTRTIIKPAQVVLGDQALCRFIAVEFGQHLFF